MYGNCWSKFTRVFYLQTKGSKSASVSIKIFTTYQIHLLIISINQLVRIIHTVTA